jgi:hypothetical protein
METQEKIRYIVDQLPTHLFWDSDLSKLDDLQHYEKIIVRTFERGDLEDMALVMAYYGKKICREVLKNASYLQESAILLGSLFLTIDKEDFKSSYKKQFHLV